MSQLPNVIFIITDDQGYGDICYHGNPVLKTPSLDQMARESVQLDNHHHDPLCSPSRAALLTGQYAARNGVWHVIHGRHLLQPDALTMADHFSANGYRTAMFGKWHLGDNYPFAPQFRGFDEVLCHRGGGVGELPDYWGNNYVDDTYFHNGEPLPCNGYCTDVFFAAATDFISEDEDRPFFVYLATNAMHGPHIVPETYAAPYLEAGVPDERARFYGMIANFDENIGKLFARLKQLDIDDDTILIFTADHGTAAGFDPTTGSGYNAGLRGIKGSVYDGGHQVNFFLRWPGMLPAARKISQPTAHIDILPTLINLCGLSADKMDDFDGISLAPLIRGEENKLAERSIVIQLQPDKPQKWHHSAVVGGHWRLINGDELYNVEIDQSQEHDIAAEYPEVVAALKEEYDEWWASMQGVFSQFVAIPVGSHHADPVLLSARDWHPTVGRVPWRQVWIDDPAFDANGFWIIDVVAAGCYQVELRTHPREANLPMCSAYVTLQIGEVEFRQSTCQQQTNAVFEAELPLGEASLRTSITSADRRRDRGAYYVYVSKL